MAWCSYSTCGPQSALGPTSKSGASSFCPGNSGASDVGTGLLVLGRSWSSSFPAVSLASIPESWWGMREVCSRPAFAESRGEVHLLLPAPIGLGLGVSHLGSSSQNQLWFSWLHRNLAPKGPSSARLAWFRKRSACPAQLRGVDAGALSTCESFPQNCHDQEQPESAPSRQAVGGQ